MGYGWWCSSESCNVHACLERCWRYCLYNSHEALLKEGKKMFHRALVRFDYALRDVTAALSCVKHWRSRTLWEWTSDWRHTRSFLLRDAITMTQRMCLSLKMFFLALSLILKVFACCTQGQSFLFSEENEWAAASYQIFEALHHLRQTAVVLNKKSNFLMHILTERFPVICGRFSTTFYSIEIEIIHKMFHASLHTTPTHASCPCCVCFMMVISQLLTPCNIIRTWIMIHQAIVIAARSTKR